MKSLRDNILLAIIVLIGLSAAALKVNAQPVFVSNYGPDVSQEGTSVKFTANVGVYNYGVSGWSYYWSHNGVKIDSSTSSRYGFSTTTNVNDSSPDITFTISNIQFSDAGDYTITVTDAKGVTTSNKLNLGITVQTKDGWPLFSKTGTTINIGGFKSDVNLVEYDGYYTGLGGDVTIPASYENIPVTTVQYLSDYNRKITTLRTTNSTISFISFYSLSLSSIYISSTVSKIGLNNEVDCFSTLFNLATINVDSGNSVYGSVNSMLLNKNLDTLIYVPVNVPNTTTSYPSVPSSVLLSTIPSTVTTINTDALSSLEQECVIIPSSVKTIQDLSFRFFSTLHPTIIYFLGAAPSSPSSSTDLNNITVIATSANIATFGSKYRGGVAALASSINYSLTTSGNSDSTNGDNYGPTSGGSKFSIFGTGIEFTTNVYVGSALATNFKSSIDSNANYSVTAVAPAGSGVVDVTATNIFGITSPIVINDKFFYVTQPVITSDLSYKTDPTGATLSVSGSGNNLSYKWYYNNTLSSTTHSPSIAVDKSGTYYVVIYNSIGSVTSSSVNVSLTYPITITTQPVSQVVSLGNSASFSVVATGSALTYQWYFNNVAITGATSPTYSISSITANNVGGYYVAITNSYGTTTTSSLVSLSLSNSNSAPTITSYPKSVSVASGSSATFSVTATGTNLTYQWYFNNVAITGATSASYTINSATSTNVGNYYVIIYSNPSNYTTSNTVTLSMSSSGGGGGSNVSIVAQPFSTSVVNGGTTVISVIASGTNLTYQWYFNGSALAGATSSRLTITNATTANAGSYYVIVSSGSSSATSDTATLSVSSDVSIVVQPTSQTVATGASVTLSVVASGGSLTYQWYFNGTPISGATSSGYTIASASTANAGSYTVVVSSNGLNPITSSTATLTVNGNAGSPTITLQPISQTVSLGSSCSLSVNATGTNLTYQWYYNGSAISGATASTYTIAAATSANAGSYYVKVSNSNGTLNSSTVTLTVSTTDSLPVFTLQPQSQSVASGLNVSFTVLATGSNSLSYQWYFNNTLISGATGATYTLTNVQPLNSGTYSVKATNSLGSTVSNSAILTINSAAGPKISTQPVSVTSAAGATVTFSVNATGTVATSGLNKPILSTKAQSAYTYQWLFNGSAISGATNSTYITVANQSNAGNYQCLIINGSGSTLSSSALLTVAQTTNPGRLVNLSVLTLDGNGSQMLTLGFVCGNSGSIGTQSILARGIGPALLPFGVTNVLPDPTITILSGSNTVNKNSGWASSQLNQNQVTTADAATGAFTLTNPASADSASVVNLSPGSYTIQVSSASGSTGNALAEVYDNTPKGSYTATSPRLINLSCLQQVVAKGILTAGFVINGDTAVTVLVRVSGPALTTYSVPGVMADPQLTVFDSNTKVLGTNAGWGGNAAITAANTSTGAFPLTDPNSADSAILLTLNPGSYSVQASSVSGKAGSALIEVYEVK
jgi:Immunoglobulin domain/Immunoglobulin I-set domain